MTILIGFIGLSRADLAEKNGTKMTSRKISNAKGLYLEGIRDGHIVEALDKYTGDRYTQHSTGVGDGKTGFMEFFGPFIDRNPVRDIRVVRAIEDGPYVFLHVYQSLNNGEAEWVTADLFDTDGNDRMIEHWDVIAPYVGKTASGRTSVDGSTEIEDLELTDANKETVRRFIDNILMNSRADKITNYISPNRYDQHAAEIGDGLDGLMSHFQRLQASGEVARYHKVHNLIGQGNFVVAFSHLQKGASHYAVFDIFRLKGGKLLEHWDVQEKILAPEEWNNSGKF